MTRLTNIRASGQTSELGARYVSVVTRDGREYLIPNEDLITGQVVNGALDVDSDTQGAAQRGLDENGAALR